MYFSRFLFFIGLFFYNLLGIKTSAQNLTAGIELGESLISIERPYTITVVIQNSETRPSIDFPEIKGLLKQGISTSMRPSISEKKTGYCQVITQSYRAFKPGQYRLAPFSLTVGEITLRSEGAAIIIRPTSVARAYSHSTTSGESGVSLTIKDNVFLTLSVSQTRVYIGEGVSVKLTFFVPDAYPLELNFFELDQQLQQLLKRLRPANCWEENFGITELKPQLITLSGKRYSEYRIYQATFFPLSKQPIRFPSVGLRVIQLQPSTTPGGVPNKEAITFYTRPLTVNVMELPPHPLRDQVPVGQFRLLETISRRAPGTGQSVRYNFRVSGEGNIASLAAPVVPVTAGLDVFPPEASQNIIRMNDKISGFKSFQYTLIPRQKRSYSLDSLFHWIYFDPQRQRYDTLQSTFVLRVGGSSHSGRDTVQVSLPGSIYTGIEKADSSQQTIHFQEIVRVVANTLLIGMALGMMYLLLKK